MDCGDDDKGAEATWRPIVACAASLARGVLRHVGAAYDWAHVRRTVAFAKAIVDGLDCPCNVDRELVVVGCILYEAVNPRQALSTFTTPEAVAASYADYLTDRGHLRDQPARLAKLERILRRATIDTADPPTTSKGAVLQHADDGPPFIEMDVVCDANRLDGLGPVGVARACMLGAVYGWTLVGPRTPTLADWVAAGRPRLAPDGSVATYVYGHVLTGPRSVMATPVGRVMAQPLVRETEAQLDALITQARNF